MIYYQAKQFLSLETLNKFLLEEMIHAPYYGEYVDLKVNTYEQGGALYTLIYKFEDE